VKIIVPVFLLAFFIQVKIFLFIGETGGNFIAFEEEKAPSANRKAQSRLAVNFKKFRRG